MQATLTNNLKKHTLIETVSHTNLPKPHFRNQNNVTVTKYYVAVCNENTICWASVYPHRGSHTNHDSVMGPKGIDNTNAAFFVYLRKMDCGDRDGWMLLFVCLFFSISDFRWLRCCVMLLKNSVYIYNIYKLKIITIMQ